MIARTTHAPTTRTSATVVVIALAALATLLVTSCQNASAPWTSDVPSGHLDAVSLDSTGTKLTVQGWAGDRNTTEPIDVVVFINLGLQPGAITADLPRPDVLANTGRGAHSGFSKTFTVGEYAPLPSFFGPGPLVCVSAVNVGPGDHALLGCMTATRDAAPATTTPKSPTTTTPSVTPADCDALPAPEVDWHGCDKSGVDLSTANLTKANLTGANLTETNLNYAKLTGAGLTGADLSYAALIHADLTNANLTKANLTGANLSDAVTSGANITSVVWDNTTCPDGNNSGVGGTCVGHGF